MGRVRGAHATALAAALASLALLPGCVTRGKYRDLEAERDRLQAERESQAEYIVSMERRMEVLNASRDELIARVSQSEVEVEVLRGTYDELVGELEAEVASGQIQIEQIREGVRVKLAQEILFPSGSAELDEGGRSVITRVAEQIRDDRALVTVEGHTDNVGISTSLKRRYPTNWELAGARAASVVRVLSEGGVPPERLRAVSRGPFAPVAPNDTREGRAQNRRIEILLRPVEPR